MKERIQQFLKGRLRRRSRGNLGQQLDHVIQRVRHAQASRSFQVHCSGERGGNCDVD